MAPSNDNTVYLIVGANKGIGLGLVQALLARPHTTVIATVRNDARAKDLSDLSSKMTKGSESALHIFQADLSRVPDLADLKHRVDADILPVSDHVDVFISSVGFTTAMKPALETTPQEFRDHFEVNTIGPLIVFQAFWPLMVKPNADDESEKSSRQPSAPKLIFLSSSVGCIGEWMEPITGGAYGPSKAALNWLARKLHFELEKDKIVSVALHPGWVQTEMGDLAAKSWGYPGKPPTTVDQSVQGILQVVDGATRENASGKFLSYDGKEIPW